MKNILFIITGAAITACSIFMAFNDVRGWGWVFIAGIAVIVLADNTPTDKKGIEYEKN
jgi:hypothetical protein